MHAVGHKDKHMHVTAHTHTNAFSQNGDVNTDRDSALYAW